MQTAVLIASFSSLENYVQTISSLKTRAQQFWSRHRVPTHEITYRTPHEAEAGVAVGAVVEVEREVVVLVWISTRLEFVDIAPVYPPFITRYMDILSLCRCLLSSPVVY